MTMIKFPSIDQFRHVIRAVQYKTNYAGKDENGKPQFVPRTQPKLNFRGTVKLHGTNAAIVSNPELHYQSRERILTLERDNAGFVLAMKKHESALHEMFKLLDERLISSLPEDVNMSHYRTAVFGEWAGQGIQKGVAITSLPKFFSIFAVRVETPTQNYWLDIGSLRDIEIPDARIFNVLRFGEFNVTIDFEKPIESQNELAELTLQVEQACPAGKHFGVEGTGEGVVWTCTDPGWLSSDFWFKVKGEKHSATKVTKLASVDTEALRAVREFVEATVTESRLEQGLQHVLNEQALPFDPKAMGPFIQWVYKDIIKEETDTIVANQLDPKKLGGPIADKARKWFFEKFNNDESGIEVS